RWTRSRNGWEKSSSKRLLRRHNKTLPTTAISLPRLARRNPLAAIGVVFVTFFVICAIFAPWLAPQDPAHIDLTRRLAPPSPLQVCGSDELGRDILSRLIYGSRNFLLGGSGGGGASPGNCRIIGFNSRLYRGAC